MNDELRETYAHSNDYYKPRKTSPVLNCKNINRTGLISIYLNNIQKVTFPLSR
jgi:hypothetical protein